MSALIEAVELSKKLGGAGVAVTDPRLGDQLPHGIRWDPNTQTVVVSGPLPKDKSGSFVMSNGALFPMPSQK